MRENNGWSGDSPTFDEFVAQLRAENEQIEEWIFQQWDHAVESEYVSLDRTYNYGKDVPDKHKNDDDLRSDEYWVQFRTTRFTRYKCTDPRFNGVYEDR